MLNLFGLIPKGGAAVGDVWDRDAADRVVGHSAHEQQLVTAPGQKHTGSLLSSKAPSKN